MAHGEGLSRQNAVGDDAAEQLALFHGGQQEADGIFLLRKADERVVVMDIVDLARIFLQIIVEEVLQDADGQLTLVLIEDDGAGLLARVPLDREAFGTCAGLFKRFEQLLWLGLEDDAVDRLEDLRRVVDVSSSTSA